MFGKRPDFNFDGDPEETREDPTQPAAPADVTPIEGKDEEDEEVAREENLQPIEYDGFASYHPLLVERPTKYVNRLRACAKSLIIPPENDTHGGTDGRILLDSAIALPVPTTMPGDMLTSEQALGYPLFYAPVDREWSVGGDVSYGEYVLTLILTYTMLDIIHEENQSVYAYPLSLDSRITIPDDAWEYVTHLAHEMYPLLGAVNRGRLAGLAIYNAQQYGDKSEADMWNKLAWEWGITIPPNETLDRADEAAEKLQPYYEEVYGDLQYAPYFEN